MLLSTQEAIMLEYDRRRTESIVAKLETVVGVLSAMAILVHCVFFGAIGAMVGLIVGASVHQSGGDYAIVAGLIGLVFGYWLGSNAFTVFGVTLEWMAQLLIAQGEILAALRLQQAGEFHKKGVDVLRAPTPTTTADSVPSDDMRQPQTSYSEAKAAPESQLDPGDYANIIPPGSRLVQRSRTASQLAEADYVSILGRGVTAWNQWRTEHPDDEPNLSGANLHGENLREVNFNKANLRTAGLQKADLSGANLEGANLARANLFGAALAETNLSSASLTGATMPDGSVHP
jgi:hypothetical protein